MMMLLPWFWGMVFGALGLVFAWLFEFFGGFSSFLVVFDVFGWFLLVAVVFSFSAQWLQFCFFCGFMRFHLSFEISFMDSCGEK